MAILIRTRDVPPEELRDAWRAVVCDTLGPLDFRSDPDIPLRGEIAAGQLGPVSVGRVETSTPHSVYRTPGLIRRDMLLTDTVFASYARNGVVDATAGTEAILVLGVETRDQVDQLADRAEAAGGSPVGTPT